MVAQSHNIRNYGAWGVKHGKCIWGELHTTERNRRDLALRAARELHNDADNTAKYLSGLEAGMKQAGAIEASARRLRYEVAAVIASYDVTVEVEIPRGVVHEGGELPTTKVRLDATNLESQETWLGLINTARKMRNAATNRKRLENGLSPQIGRGNHTVRKFHDDKFDRLREQLIERTAPNQALDLLDAAIIAITNAYSAIVSKEIETLREVEERIHDRVNARNLKDPMMLNPVKQRLQRVA